MQHAYAARCVINAFFQCRQTQIARAWKFRPSLHLPLFFFCRYISTWDRGAEESTVPLARDLHPEFGYVGSAPRLFRKLGLVSAFVVFGLMAGASGVAVFMAGPEPDPMNAMALAPAEALISTSASSALPATAKAVEGQKAFNAGVTQSPCRDYVSERLGDDCTSVRVHRPHPAMNERPAIAAVAIGHREDPAALPPQPAVPVAAIPEIPPDGSAVPAVSGEVPAAAPAGPVAKQSRARSSRHVARREGYSSSSGRSVYFSTQKGGYAGLW
jgi:hypothetical protein